MIMVAFRLFCFLGGTARSKDKVAVGEVNCDDYD